jgi:hypothetical protein
MVNALLVLVALLCLLQCLLHGLFAAHSQQYKVGLLQCLLHGLFVARLHCRHAGFWGIDRGESV